MVASLSALPNFFILDKKAIRGAGFNCFIKSYFGLTDEDIFRDIFVQGDRFAGFKQSGAKIFQVVSRFQV